jgi:peptide methionine sulfoxide reductase MsrB
MVKCANCGQKIDTHSARVFYLGSNRVVCSKYCLNLLNLHEQKKQTAKLKRIRAEREQRKLSEFARKYGR